MPDPTIGSIESGGDFISRIGASLETGLSNILSDGLPIWFNEQVLARGRNNQDDRKFLLESIKYVDKVEIFNSPEELETLIKKAKPFALVVGSDWRGKKVVGDQYAQVVDFFGRIGEYSTTTILGEDK